MVIDVESTRCVRKQFPAIKRQTLITIACLLTMAIPVLWGESIVQALLSGSHDAWPVADKNRSIASLSANTYCSGLAEGLEQTSSGNDMFWKVRRFGGRMMNAGTRVDVLERGEQVTQVRDPQSASICYVASSEIN